MTEKQHKNPAWMSRSAAIKTAQTQFIRICPITAGRPTTMTEKGFKAACDAHLVKAEETHGPYSFKSNRYRYCRECMGKKRPSELKIIKLNGFAPDGEKIMSQKKIKGTCEMCGKAGMIGKNHGIMACSQCAGVQAHISKRPDVVVAEIKRLHGDKYFKAADVQVVPVDELFGIEVLGKIRDALRVDGKPMVADLPELINERISMLKTFKADNKKFVAENMALRNEIETKVALIKDLVGEDEAHGIAAYGSTAAGIGRVCDRLKKLLIDKNASYGDSAMQPMRVFSRASAMEQLLVRIDDKLSRLAMGSEFPGDDTIWDLAGYLVLLMVKREAEELQEAV